MRWFRRGVSGRSVRVSWKRCQCQGAGYILQRHHLPDYNHLRSKWPKQPYYSGFARWLQWPDANGCDNLASAIGAPITLNGQKAYGVFISPGIGYRNNKANGTAVGDASEGMYAVLDGTHFNGQCCFDYGNAETSSRDTGNGHMEAIYYGDSTVWGTGSGNGPWVMADLENGLFSGALLRVKTAITRP